MRRCERRHRQDGQRFAQQKRSKHDDHIFNTTFSKTLRGFVCFHRGVTMNRKSRQRRKQKRIKTVAPKGFEGTWNQRLRRRKVFEMRMLSKTVRQMMTQTGSSSATIIADLKAIDAALRKTIDHTQATAVLNERLSNLEALRDIALRGADTSRGNEQIGYLNTAIKLEEQITKLLQDAGVLRKAMDGAPLQVAPAPIIVRITRSKESDAAVKLFGKRPPERT